MTKILHLLGMYALPLLGFWAFAIMIAGDTLMAFPLLVIQVLFYVWQLFDMCDSTYRKLKGMYENDDPIQTYYNIEREINHAKKEC